VTKKEKTKESAMGNNRIEKIKDLHVTPINKHKRTQCKILLWILNKWHLKPATVA